MPKSKKIDAIFSALKTKVETIKDDSKKQEFLELLQLTIDNDFDNEKSTLALAKAEQDYFAEEQKHQDAISTELKVILNECRRNPSGLDDAEEQIKKTNVAAADKRMVDAADNKGRLWLRWVVSKGYNPQELKFYHIECAVDKVLAKEGTIQ